MSKIKRVVPVLSAGRKGGHLVYFAGVFLSGHGFYVWAAAALFIIEGTLWVMRADGEGE